MHDDSEFNSSGKRKSQIKRSQTSITDSFRMAASVLTQGSGPNKKALTLTISGKNSLMKGLK